MKTNVRTGKLATNHNQTGIVVRTKVKAGLNYTKITYSN